MPALTEARVQKLEARYKSSSLKQRLKDDETILKACIEEPPNGPDAEWQLYQFLTALCHEPMPWQPICKGEGEGHENHASPWDYIWHSYRVDLPEWRDKASRHLIYVGPRGGYKTLSVAKLIAAELILKRGCWTVGMGAIEAHAKRTYQYVQRYLSHPILQSMKAIEFMKMEETKLWNGSVYNQVCATWAGVNSQHPQKMRTEENDLISDELILEEAKMMPSSHGNIRAHMSYVSSRKFEDGIMDRLVENAKAKGYDVLISCYKDSAETCTEARHGGPATKPVEVEDIFNPGKTIILPPETIFANCAECPILPSCQGALAKAKGAVAIDDVISDWKVLDRDVWIWQKECKRSKSGNTFFQFWNELRQEGSFPYRPEWGPVDLSFDFTGGGEDPTVMGVWQEYEDNDYMIGELQFDGNVLADSVADDIYDYLQSRKITQFRHMFGDSAAQTWIKELNSKTPRGHERFFRITPVKKIERSEGWKLFRQRIRDNSGYNHIFVDKAACPLFCKEVKAAKKSKSNPNDIPKTCSDHSLDQARYRLVQLRHVGTHSPNIRVLGTPYGHDPVDVVTSGDPRSKSREDHGLARYLTDTDLDQD